MIKYMIFWLVRSGNSLVSGRSALLATSLVLWGTCGVYAQDFSQPEATEVWDPVPPSIVPGEGAKPPSDAIVLFGADGDKKNWTMAKDSAECQWEVHNDILTIKRGTGNLKTRQQFGDCQLHIEFMLPTDATDQAHPTNSGNSGVFLQGRYEIQIFDSYTNGTPLYSNGQTGSVYKQAIPHVNASKKNGEWNAFDIYYTAPRFRYNGTVERPAYVTVVHNGVLLLNHFEIQGTIQYIGIPHYEPHGKAAIELQEHGSEVSFRNIWIREIPATSSLEGDIKDIL